MSLFEGFSGFPRVPRLKVEYLVVDNGGEYPGDARTLGDEVCPGPLEEWELESLARSAAEHDFGNHCGYERYPNGGDDAGAFEIYVGGKSVGVFDVFVETVPQFSASRRKDKAPGAGGAVL